MQNDWLTPPEKFGGVGRLEATVWVAFRMDAILWALGPGELLEPDAARLREVQRQDEIPVAKRVEIREPVGQPELNEARRQDGRPELNEARKVALRAPVETLERVELRGLTEALNAVQS